MSKVRPQVPIIGFTPDAETARQLSMLWGVYPALVPTSNTVEEMIETVEDGLMQAKIVQPGDQVVIIASLPVGAMGPANFTLLHSIGGKPEDRG